MFSPFTCKRTGLTKSAGHWASLKGTTVLSAVLVVGICRCEANVVEIGKGGDLGQTGSNLVVSNIAQFRSVARNFFLGDGAFQLNGIVTLVDTNRSLIVLQDETGAVALNPKIEVRDLGVQIGQLVSLEGSRCSSYVVGFPNYPYRPSGWEVRPSLKPRRIKATTI